jgi:hypothetical protein
MIKRSVAVALALTLSLGTVAEAATVYRTFLTLNVNRKAITVGQKVKFNGKLSSPFKKCYRYRPVALIQKTGTRIKTLTGKRVDRFGRFIFYARPRKTSTFWVKFNGRSGGKHPNQWTCRPSTSRKIKITVRR